MTFWQTFPSKIILKRKVEFKLPNGEIAIIPEAWLTKYADLFALSETEGDNEKPVLRKHHLNLVKELEEGNLAKVHLSEKLRGLNSFSGIKDYPVPAGFKGALRPYQRAGFNWLRFLNDPEDYASFMPGATWRALLVATVLTLSMAAFGLYQVHMRLNRTDLG